MHEDQKQSSLQPWICILRSQVKHRDEEGVLSGNVTSYLCPHSLRMTCWGQSSCLWLCWMCLDVFRGPGIIRWLPKSCRRFPGGHSSGSYLLTPSRAPWNLKWGLAQSSQVWQTPRKVWNFLLNVRQKHISETMKKESPCQKACRVLTISVDFKKYAGCDIKKKKVKWLMFFIVLSFFFKSFQRSLLKWSPVNSRK